MRAIVFPTYARLFVFSDKLRDFLGMLFPHGRKLSGVRHRGAQVGRLVVDGLARRLAGRAVEHPSFQLSLLPSGGR